MWRRLFRDHVSDLARPFDVSRVATSYVSCERAYGRKTLITGLDRAAPNIFYMGQELQQAFGREIVDRQSIICFPELLCHERHQQREGIPVALLCVSSKGYAQ